jgi:hypothetical protein
VPFEELYYIKNIEEHFQPEAGNELLKAFVVKSTPISNAYPYSADLFIYSRMINQSRKQPILVNSYHD